MDFSMEPQITAQARAATGRFSASTMARARWWKPCLWPAKSGRRSSSSATTLTGSISVKFNGKAATFKVVSDTEITATVPSGATTGKVSVVTPSGTLNSNPQFVVTK